MTDTVLTKMDAEKSDKMDVDDETENVDVDDSEPKKDKSPPIPTTAEEKEEKTESETKADDDNAHTLKLDKPKENKGDAIDDIVLPHASASSLNERRESKDNKSKKELEEEEREKMQVLVSNFTEDQLDRYEMYRRATFPKAAIKRIMQTITGCSVSQNVVIAMSGMAKVFIGEIVEKALDVMEEHDESGPVQPKHLREAVRRLRSTIQIPHGKSHKSFCRL